MSPVWNQPSARAPPRSPSRCCSSRGRSLPPLSRISPSSAISHGAAGDRPADRADLHRVRPVDRRAGGRLGQAVALVDRDADSRGRSGRAAHRAARRRRSRRSPCRRGRRAACRRRARRRPGAGTSSAARCHDVAVEGLAVVDRDPLGEVEDRALAVGVRPLLRGVVDLLEHPRHRQHERRLERGEVRHQVLDVGGVAHPHPALHAADLDDPGEDVRERQEQQRRLVVAEHLLETLGGGRSRRTGSCRG